MTSNEMCNTGQSPAAPPPLSSIGLSGTVFSKKAKNEFNAPKGPENIILTMMMYGETFYGHHMAQHQLPTPLASCSLQWAI